MFLEVKAFWISESFLKAEICKLRKGEQLWWVSLKGKGIYWKKKNAEPKFSDQEPIEDFSI